MMEGIARLPGARAAAWQRDHPGTDIWRCKATGRWYAWVPDDGDGCAGEAASGRDEAELIAKLDGG